MKDRIMRDRFIASPSVYLIIRHSLIFFHLFVLLLRNNILLKQDNIRHKRTYFILFINQSEKKDCFNPIQFPFGYNTRIWL